MRHWPVVALFCLVFAGCGPAPRTGGAADPKDPDACRSAADCPVERPVCVDGRCLPCRDDGDCVNAVECRKCAPGGRCLASPDCCWGDLDCLESFECERPPGHPVGTCVSTP